MKRILIVIVVLALLAAFFGCTKGVTPNVDIEPECFDNRYGNWNAGVVETSDAYYWNHDNSSEYVYYYDKASGTGGVLCGRPECIHDQKENNAECLGYIGVGVPSLNVSGGKLYFVSDHLEEGVGWMKALYQMDPDSANRALVMKFSIPEEYAPQRYDLHMGRLYAFSSTNTVHDAESCYSGAILCWEIGSQEPAILFEKEYATTPFAALFYTDNYVYFCMTARGKESFKAAGEVYRVGLDSAEAELLLAMDGSGGMRWCIWVDEADTVYAAPQYAWDERFVYRIEEGEAVPVLELKEGASVMLYGGMALAWYDEGSGPGIELKKLDGTLMYCGPVSLDFLEGFGNGACLAGWTGLFFDEDKVLYSTFVSGPEDEGSIASCLVEYKLVDGRLTENLLCVDRGQ